MQQITCYSSYFGFMIHYVMCPPNCLYFKNEKDTWTPKRCLHLETDANGVFVLFECPKIKTLFKISLFQSMQCKIHVDCC